MWEFPKQIRHVDGNMKLSAFRREITSGNRIRWIAIDIDEDDDGVPDRLYLLRGGVARKLMGKPKGENGTGLTVQDILDATGIPAAKALSVADLGVLLGKTKRKRKAFKSVALNEIKLMTKNKVVDASNASIPFPVIDEKGKISAIAIAPETLKVKPRLQNESTLGFESIGFETVGTDTTDSNHEKTDETVDLALSISCPEEVNLNEWSELSFQVELTEFAQFLDQGVIAEAQKDSPIEIMMSTNTGFVLSLIHI